MISKFIICFASCCSSGDSIDAGQFLRIMEGMQSQVHDFSMIYEGKFEFVGPQKLLPFPAVQMTKDFQGTYDYRQDGAIRLDLYQRPKRAGASLFHTKSVILGNKLEEVQLIPDLLHHTDVKTIGGAEPASLNRSASPHRFLFQWLFQSLSARYDAQFLGYEYQGWESVDGHRCLKVRFNLYPGIPELAGQGRRCWIDLERGGHPLKVEQFDENGIVDRTHHIQLRRFDLPGGGTTWFPISGVAETFIWDEGSGTVYHKFPICRETYTIVNGSLRFNQNLQDSAFSLDRGPGANESSGLKALRREFDAASSRPASPPLRIDSAGVQEQLNANLAEADRQAKMIEASSTARATWGWTPTLQLGFGLLGVICLGGVAAWKWKGR